MPIPSLYSHKYKAGWYIWQQPTIAADWILRPALKITWDTGRARQVAAALPG
jgi:hypothetical protein